MKKGWLKYIVFIIVAVLLAYNSVYFKKLDAKTNTTITATEANLSPVTFARSFWDNTFSKAIDSAITLESFEKEFFEKGGQVTIEKYAHSQGVSDVAYMLLKYRGKVKEITEDKIVLIVADSRTNSYVFNIGNYFGNGVRDATGLIKMGDFVNTMDYNLVSTELNKIVKTDVILPGKNKIKINDNLTIVASVEIKNGRLDGDLLPVKIIVNN